jgi:hypothetical protein
MDFSQKRAYWQQCDDKLHQRGVFALIQIDGQSHSFRLRAAAHLHRWGMEESVSIPQGAVEWNGKI